MLLAHRRNLDHRIGYRGRCSTPIGLNPGGELGVPKRRLQATSFPRELVLCLYKKRCRAQKQTYEDASEELDHSAPADR